MLAKLDLQILKLVKHIADWVDYNWHVNNYMIACWILRFTALCVASTVVSFALKFPKDHAWNIFLAATSAGISYMVYRGSERTRRASEKFERTQGHIPTEAYGLILCGPVIRLLPFIVSGCMILLTATNDASMRISWLYIILDCFIWSWNGYDGIATYFGAIPPSIRSRKPKKSRDWSFGLSPQSLGAA